MVHIDVKKNKYDTQDELRIHSMREGRRHLAKVMWLGLKPVTTTLRIEASVLGLHALSTAPMPHF